PNRVPGVTMPCGDLKSGREEERQRELRFRVEPLPPAGETRALHEAPESGRAVLVRALGPDEVPLFEVDGRGASPDPDPLALERDEPHFDARFRGVEHRPVRESREIEIPAELAVDPEQHVLVERGGDAEGVVVRQDQVGLRLDEVCAEKERVARPERVPDRAEELARGGAVEIPEVRSEEEDEEPPVAVAALRDAPQSLLVGGPVAD